jgi:ectoine hydroxylase
MAAAEQISQSTPTPRRLQRLGAAQLADYERDGYLFLRGFFAPDEIAPLQQACAADPEIGGALQAVADSSGKPQEVVSWSRLSDDLVGVFPRVARLVNATEDLIGKPVYHWHSKLSMKKPGSEGRWDWHQDYGYWYYEGCLAPDMLTCMIAVDPSHKENGCVQLVRASHRLGRIDHTRVGEATGVDPQRLAEIMKTHEVIDTVLQPGDAVFFHCNTLHASGSNKTDRPRTLLHCSYNAIANSPFVEGQEHHAYKPLEKLPDSAIRDGKFASIFERQEFFAAANKPQVNRYGYKMLKYATRGNAHEI